MYYKNIYQDIVESDFGTVSTLFEKNPKTLLQLTKDYLYAQGHFNTLALIHKQNDPKTTSKGKSKEISTEFQVDEREAFQANVIKEPLPNN